MVDHYNSVLAELLDKHVPAKWKEIKIRHNQPWFLDRIKEEIRLHRWKERCWRSDNTEYNYRAFYNQRLYVANLIYAAKKTFIKEQIAECGKDVKSIFKLMNKLLFCKDKLPLPQTENAQTLPDSFNDFFTTKITNIIKDLELTFDDQTSSDYIKSSYETPIWLSQFETP